MTIRIVSDNKKQFLDLLLLGDEQESMIDRYLEQGDLFALYDGDLKTVGVVVGIDDSTCELKNIATYEKYQGKGYGSTLINYLFDYFKDKYKTMLVGTGDVPSALSFYKRCGFELSHRVKNFFTDHYDHPMFEDGIQLVDMVYLKKDLSAKKTFHIRQATVSDIPEMKMWLNKNHVRDFFGNPDEWVSEINENIDSDWIQYFIVETDCPVGFVQYYETAKAPQGDWSSEPEGTVGIDYLIGDENLLGKGYGAAIIGLLIDEIRSKKKYNYVIADPVTENIASVKVLEKNGFSLQENGWYRLKL